MKIILTGCVDPTKCAITVLHQLIEFLRTKIGFIQYLYMQIGIEY